MKNKGRPWTEEEIRSYHKRYLAGERVADILRPAKRSYGSFYDHINKLGLPKKSDDIKKASKPRIKKHKELEIPIVRPQTKMGLVFGTPQEISQFVEAMWK